MSLQDRGRVNQAQMKKLLDILSEDGVLVNGKVSYSGTNKQTFWKRIALQLNSVEGGVYKNTWKWCKMWADWKNKTTKKANILLRKKHYSHTPSVSALNTLELRLLKMIHYPLDDKADVVDMEMINKVEIPEPTPDEISGFLTEGFDPPLNQDQDNISSDQEDSTALAYFTNSKSQFCDVEDIQDGDTKFEVLEESLHTDMAENGEKKVKMKGKKFKKLKTSLEEFKIRTTLAIEKERLQQKSEELRLRALELKLKGDELRLKEIETNKINYLTSLEEEKLKCFKDISASLTELLDRTRNGNVRFHNVL